MQPLKSIYVVEDDSTARTMMLDFLEQYKDVKVKGFTTGEAAIGDIVFHKAAPDLVLMDYYLEGSIVTKYHGLGALAEIKKISPSTRVIMFTSAEHEDLMKLAMEQGATAFIVKGQGGFEDLKRIIAGNFRLS